MSVEDTIYDVAHLFVDLLNGFGHRCTQEEAWPRARESLARGMRSCQRNPGRVSLSATWPLQRADRLFTLVNKHAREVVRDPSTKSEYETLDPTAKEELIEELREAREARGQTVRHGAQGQLLDHNLALPNITNALDGLAVRTNSKFILLGSKASTDSYIKRSVHFSGVGNDDDFFKDTFNMSYEKALENFELWSLGGLKGE